MTLYRNRYRVEPARLCDWDYSLPGCYFVTVCAHDRKELFGKITNNEMRLNENGEIVENCWKQTPIHFPNVLLDECVVMPNHVHGIIRLSGMGSDGSRSRDVACNVSTQNRKCNVSTKNESNKFTVISPQSGSLPVIIRSFKSAVTKRMHAAGYNGPVWQPRFYDHIIREEKSLFQIRTYNRNNPVKSVTELKSFTSLEAFRWGSDEENPFAKSPRYVAMLNPQKAVYCLT